jgi:hypothetical protein
MIASVVAKEQFSHSLESFRTQAQLALAESEDRRLERIAFAHKMQKTHSFDQRAEQILAKVADLGG